MPDAARTFRYRVLQLCEGRTGREFLGDLQRLELKGRLCEGSRPTRRKAQRLPSEVFAAITYALVVITGSQNSSTKGSQDFWKLGRVRDQR